MSVCWRGLRQADADGFGVAFITCGNDPAVQAARDLLTTPVVSATESAMLLACTLGLKFGCVTFDEESTVLVERNIRAFGLEDRALRHKPARSAGFYEACDTWFTDPDYLRNSVIPKFEEAARSLIADGADVIVGACGNFAALPYHGYTKVTGTEVPVLDAVMSGGLYGWPCRQYAPHHGHCHQQGAQLQGRPVRDCRPCAGPVCGGQGLISCASR
jgi:Asp/Glu/hydantoin racemase